MAIDLTVALEISTNGQRSIHLTSVLITPPIVFEATHVGKTG